MLKLYRNETDKEIQVWCSDVEAIQKWDRQGNTSMVFRRWNYTEMRQTRKVFPCLSHFCIVSTSEHHTCISLSVSFLYSFHIWTPHLYFMEIQVWCSDVEAIQKWDRQGNTSMVFRCWNYTEMRQTRKYKCGVQTLKPEHHTCISLSVSFLYSFNIWTPYLYFLVCLISV
jgi:hypothetical protein